MVTSNVGVADSAAAKYSPNQPAFKSVPRSGPIRNNFQALAKMNELRVGINDNDRTKLVINPGHYFKDRQTVKFVAEDSDYSLSAPGSETRGTGEWILLGIDTNASNPGISAHSIGSGGDLPEIPSNIAPVAFVRNINAGQEFAQSDIIDARNIVKPPRLQSSLTF